MIPRDELHVIFGSWPFGLAVMRELVAQGKRVRLVNPTLREVAEMLYEFNKPFVVDN
jgi:hypothetical protein